MKKIILSIVFLFAIIIYSKAQDEVILTTGDTLVGNLYRIGEHRYRIIKTDGKSVYVGDTLIGSIISKEIVKKQDDSYKYPLPRELNAGDYLTKANNYHFIGFGMCLLGGLSYGVYLEGLKNPTLRNQNQAFLVIGIGFEIVGFFYNEIAWGYIGEAGKKLNKSKVSLKIAPNHLGLSFKI